MLRTCNLYLLPLSAALLLLASAGIAAQQPVTLDTDPSLAAWWKLDETSGTKAADSTKHGRVGQLKGDLSFETASQPGKVGRALSIDGKDDVIEIAKYKGVIGTKPRTVAMWLKGKATSGRLLSWGTKDFGKMFNFCFIRGRVGVTPHGGYLYMNEQVNDDQWHHVAAVVEEAELPNLHDDVKLYLDGEPAEIHDIGLLDLWPIETGDQIDVVIGQGVKCLIDDIRIYERPLNEDEIKVLFKLESDKPTPKK